jgi:CheY-like chemotaxis protein
VRATGAATESAAHGAEAVDRALRGDIDLVLMDMHMPVMDGRSATQRLRASGFEAPIIALTADVLAEDVARFRAAGCNLVLSKPVDRQQLYDVLSNFLPEAMQTVSVDASDAVQSDSDPDRMTAIPPDRAQALQEALQRVRLRFAERAGEEIAGLEYEVAHADQTGLAQRLHKLKGSAGSFGYDTIYACARDAEALVGQPGQDRDAALAALIAALQAIVPSQ